MIREQSYLFGSVELALAYAKSVETPRGDGDSGPLPLPPAPPREASNKYFAVRVESGNKQLAAAANEGGKGRGLGEEEDRAMSGEGTLICCGALWTPHCHLSCHVTIL